MSLYSLAINNDLNNRVLVIADFPHIHEARQVITEWATKQYIWQSYIEVGFITHDTDVSIEDLLSSGYKTIKIM